MPDFMVSASLPEVIASLLTVMAVIFSALRVVLDYRKRSDEEARRSEQRIHEQVAPGSVDNLSALLIQNYSVLNSYYSENLAQSRAGALASISIAVLGFIAIVAGFIIGIALQQELLGSISAAAGAVSQAAAALFSRQNKAFQAQMNDSLKKLVSTQYLMTSIALARELPDGEQRVEEIIRINEHLRSLMGWLHSGDLAPSSKAGNLQPREIAKEYHP